MHLLIPKMTPMQMTLYLVALVVCWVFGGPHNDEVSYALPPLVAGGLLLGAAAAAAAPAIIKGIQAKRARKRYQESPEFKALQKLSAAARKQEAEGDYGLGDAEKRKATTEGALAFQGRMGGLQGEIARDAQDPFSAGRKRQRLKDIADASADFTAKQQTGIEQVSSKQATDERGMALNTMQAAAQQKLASENALAAANTQIWSGAAQGTGALMSGGAQMAAGGAFTPVDKMGQADAVAASVPSQVA
jgi:hypothetical protein